MRDLNNDNVDEIMFQLLEGEITGKEREALLDAIKADPAYSKLWETWQNTVLSPEFIEPEFNVESLKKKKTAVFQIYIRYAAAAAIVLAIGLFAYKFSIQDKPETEMTGNFPTKPKTTPLETPAQPDKVTPLKEVNVQKEDSVISIKEKIKHLADDSKVNSLQKEPIQDQMPEPIELVEVEKVIDPIEIKPDLPVVPVENSSIQVSVITLGHSDAPKVSEKRKGFISRLLGGPVIKLEDANTMTTKKIVIENNKYQIIAGF